MAIPDESHDPAEAELLARLRSGDESAYETLVRRHGPRLLAVARRFLRNDDEAQDAVQEAFVAAFRSLHGFREGSLLSTWLHRIAVNAALMRLRSRRRRPEEPIDDLLPRFDQGGHRIDGDSAWTPSAEDLLQRAELRGQVRAAIDRLPETYREVLLLRDIEGFDTAEAAGALGISPNAAKVRLHRARQALRTLLDPLVRGDRP